MSRDRDLRAQIVEHLDWLVRICVRQMRRRGEAFDDLVQVGTIGLLNSIDRFDPSFGVQFRTFASATISGELRRHYRGAWRLKVSRPLQERHLAVAGAIETLTGTLKRSPTAIDIAQHLRLDVDEVIEAHEVGSTFTPISLDTEETNAARAHGVDRELQRAESRTDLRELLSRLGERERRIVYLRFYCEKTQSEIADELGVSQVHVSRLLRAALETLRTPQPCEGGRVGDARVWNSPRLGRSRETSERGFSDGDSETGTAESAQDETGPAGREGSSRR